MRPLTLSAPLTDLAARQGWPAAPAAFVYHKVGGSFGFDRLRAAAASRTMADAYERLAVRRLIEDMIAEQASLSGKIMAFAGPPPDLDHPGRAVTAVSAWSALHAEAVRGARRTVEEIEKAPGDWTFAKLTIANAALGELDEG